MKNHINQIRVFLILLLTNSILAFLSYILTPAEQFNLAPDVSTELPDLPAWQFGLANAGIVLVVYGLLGLLGYWLARRLELPGIFREGAGWRWWVFIPMKFGVLSGLVLVIIDQLFGLARDWEGFPHPDFPLSLIASLTAGIGEEILFRLFVMSFWAYLLNLILRRWNLRGLSLWTANVIAALAFSAAHLPAAMLIVGADTPAGIPPIVLAELFLLNSFVALIAGERFIKDGLVAAAGVHFWADVVWHVIWGAVGG